MTDYERRLQAVIDLHCADKRYARIGGFGICAECGKKHPCPTQRAAEPEDPREDDDEGLTV